MDLEEVWRIREEDIYPSIFGGEGRGIFMLEPELFKQKFGIAEVDPRWLFSGVFEYGPTPERPYWLYVTSGHSNPWEQKEDAYDPEGESGQASNSSWLPPNRAIGQSAACRTCWLSTFSSASAISVVADLWGKVTESHCGRR